MRGRAPRQRGPLVTGPIDTAMPSHTAAAAAARAQRPRPLALGSRTLRRWRLVAALVAGAAALSSPVWPSAAEAASAVAAKTHFACSGPDSATVPCHFSTPSGNIRCRWLPSPDSVLCELRASDRALLLRPSGRAKRVRLRLWSRGQTLPRNQQIIFPRALSCHDTRTTMTCNQDFGSGLFELGPGYSRIA